MLHLVHQGKLYIYDCEIKSGNKFILPDNPLGKKIITINQLDMVHSKGLNAYVFSLNESNAVDTYEKYLTGFIERLKFDLNELESFISYLKN